MKIKLCLISFLLVEICIGAALAWTSSPTTLRPPRSRPSLSVQSFSTFSEDDGHCRDRENDFPPRETSRRRWLSNVFATSIVAASSVACSAPASAARIKIQPTAAICDPTVSVWEKGDRIIYLLGTAHISSSSAELAGQLVRDSHPDAVFVELDLKRVAGASNMARRMEANERMQISSDDDSQITKPTRVIVSPVGRSPAPTEQLPSQEPSSLPTPAPVEETKPKAATRGGFIQNLGAAAVGNGIRGLYSKLGSQGFNPGEEFVTAIREGQKLGAAVVLGDQDVDLTLRRLSQAFQQTDLNRLLNPDSELEQSMREMLPTSSNGPTNGMSEDEIFRSELTAYVETIKTKENVKRIMSLMQKEAPAIYQVMVSERDAYMEAGLNSLNEFAIITAVMGLAHVEGVETGLKRDGWKPVPVKCPKKI